MNAKDLDRYRQLLLAKRREIEAGAIGTIGAASGAAERPADVADQATDAAQADLQVHLHQTDSRLLRAIEEALARIEPAGVRSVRGLQAPISPAGWRPCPGRAYAAIARSKSKVERRCTRSTWPRGCEERMRKWERRNEKLPTPAKASLRGMEPCTRPASRYCKE